MAYAKPPKQSEKKSLRTTFLAFTAGLVVIACALVAGSNLVVSELRSSGTIASEAQNTTATLAELSAKFVEHKKIDALSLMTDGVAARPIVNSIAFYDRNGKVLLSDGRPPISLEMKQALSRAALETGDPQYRGFTRCVISVHPIYKEGQLLGVVAVELDRSVLQSEFFQSLMWNIGMSAAIIAMAIMCAAYMIRRVTDPLDILTEFAKGMSAKRLSKRVQIQTGNEFETLGWAFNRMMHRLDESMNRIQQLAYMDSITELPNRERFNRELSEALNGLGEGGMLAVMLLDIERFRWVNETLGPQRGDEALSIVGRRISKSLRAADKIVRMDDADRLPSMVARLGADEFSILIPRIVSKEQAARILQMVVASMRQPISLGEHSVTLGLSGGVAVAPFDANSAEDLIKNADLALKEAKREGKGRARFYTARLNQTALDRLTLENEIRKGIENEEFVAHYQPKISFQTGEIVGAEALARWELSSGEMISPGRFIPLAEELGLIDKIGMIILKQSCHQAARWMHNGHDCRVAVNVSPRQFEDTTFADHVLECLRTAGLPPGRLELEVTETMAVSDPEKVSEIMRPLRAMGVRLAIDDFGAGHSNLVTLTKLPFDVFKIDQQFVRALHSDKQAPAVIEMILAMAEAMGLETIAEGVETVAQSDFLRRRGCTIAQGFLYSKPLSADDYLEFMSAWRPFGDPDALSAHFG